jgi:hypothetical protein
MSVSMPITLSTSFQRVSDLLKAAAIVKGIAEPRTNWKKIKYFYPSDGSAAGNIYFTRNPITGDLTNITGYIAKLSGGDEELNKVSEREFYSEFTTNMYVLSDVNGDKLNVELSD